MPNVYGSKIVYNYREVGNSNSRGFKSNTLEINRRIFTRIQDFINTYKTEKQDDYNKAFYTYVIRRLEGSLSVYFFAKGNKDSYFNRLKELQSVLKSERYSTAINEFETGKLKASHRLTCLTAKLKVAFLVWAGYVGKQFAYQILKLARRFYHLL